VAIFTSHGMRMKKWFSSLSRSVLQWFSGSHGQEDLDL
jgi:hypothetical protein